MHGRGRIGNERVIPVREVGASPFPLSGYFLATVSLNSLVASEPLVGCPVTLTVKSPNEASALAFRVTFAAVSPCLMIGLADSMGHFFESVGERERDVPLEVLAALNTDRDFFRLSLVEGG